jgi:hypothetical protein
MHVMAAHVYSMLICRTTGWLVVTSVCNFQEPAGVNPLPLVIGSNQPCRFVSLSLPLCDAVERCSNQFTPVSSC